MHYNMLFQDRNLTNFLGRGTAPPQTPLHWGGKKPSPDPPHLLGTYGASIVAPSALHTSRFQRSVLCVPYFQCRLLATLTATNVVQGKRSQWWKFTWPPNQKSWLRQWNLCHIKYDHLVNFYISLENRDVSAIVRPTSTCRTCHECTAH